MNIINRDVYVLRDVIKDKIDYVRGTNAIPIYFHFRDYEIPEGAEAKVFVYKPSGKVVYNKCTISEQIVMVDVTDQMFIEFGLCLMQIQIRKDGRTLVTYMQPVCVHKNFVSGDVPESKNEADWIDEFIKNMQDATDLAEEILDQAQQELDKIKDVVEDAQEATEDAKEIVNSLKDYIPYRKFQPKFMASIWIYDEGNEYVKELCDAFAEMGCDGIVLPLHIDGNSACTMVENIDVVKYCISYARSVGLTCDSVKFHCTLEALATDPEAQEAYKTRVLDVLSQLEGITRVTVFNEYPNIYFSADNTQFCIDVLQAVRSAGYKVGISLTYPEQLTRMRNEYPTILEQLDVIGHNLYPRFGSKDAGTTYEDSIIAWQNYFNAMAEIKKQYPDREYIVTESSVQHFWNALAAPSYYKWPQTPGAIDGEGKVACIYFYGLFNNPAANSILDQVWVWYPEQMRYPEFYKFLRSYTGGESYV